MIRLNFQVGKEERLPAWLVASTIWFNRHEDGIDLFQLLRITEFQYPPLLGRAVFIEDAETGSLLLVKTAAAPRLERARALVPRLLVEIIRVENERLSFGVEDPAIRFLRLPVPGNVIDLGNIEVPGSHQVADIPVVGEQFLLSAKLLFLIAKLAMKIPDLRLQTVGFRLILRALVPQGIECRLSLLQRGLSDVQLLGKSASFLSHLLLRGLVTLERKFQIELGALH